MWSLSSAARMVVFAALLIVSWCVMVWTHEAGHLMGGWCCGAQLTVAEVRPRLDEVTASLRDHTLFLDVILFV